MRLSLEQHDDQSYACILFIRPLTMCLQHPRTGDKSVRVKIMPV